MHTKVLKVSKESIAIAADVIKKGGIVIYPTDTVYGIGCDPMNVSSVKRLIEVKGRSNKPLPILASSIESVERIAEMDERARKLSKAFWPGPLTLVLRKKEILPSIVTFGLPTVGVRIPDHSDVLSLIELSGGILIGTSANISGKKAPRTPEEAIEQLGDKVDLVLDGGPCKIGRPSTVLSLTSEKLAILRIGQISVEDIAKVLEIPPESIEILVS